MKERVFAKSTTAEKIIYGLGDVGANLCWTFMAMYVTMYYTDSVGISAAVAGTMMFVARIFDGISDILGAMLIEKVHFKLGKIRPWFLIAAPLLGISLFLSFHVPHGLDIQGKTLYIFITYTFTAAVSYTIYNLAFSAILPLMSMDNQDRNTAATVGRFVTTSGVTIMYFVTPLLLARWGGGKAQDAWSMISTVYALLSTVLVLAMGLFIKEKERPQAEAARQNEAGLPKESFGKMLKMVLTTKYTWILFGMFFAFYLFSGVTAVRVYYFKDVLGNLSLYSTGSMLASLPGLAALVLIPFIFSKVGKKQAVIGGMVIFVISNIIFSIFAGNVNVAYACIVVMSLAWTPLTAVIYVYIADLVDYIYMKKNVRAEGIASMTSSIGTKIGTGLGSAVVGWGLSLCGYNAIAEVQAAATQKGIIAMTTILPIVIGIALIVMVMFWNVDKEKEQAESGIQQ